MAYEILFQRQKSLVQKPQYKYSQNVADETPNAVSQLSANKL